MVSVLVIATLLLSSIPFVASSSDADSEGGNVLVDYGNGHTEWVTSTATGTVGDVVRDGLTRAGIGFSSDLTTIDGVSTVTIGSDAVGGSYTESGTTGVKVTSSWRLYTWNSSTSTWDAATESTAATSAVAVGHYPSGVAPVSTPDCRSIWTMISGDSTNSGNQTADMSEAQGRIAMENYPDDVDGVYAAILYAKHLAIVKYGESTKVGPDKTPYYYSWIGCYDTNNWTLKWKFEYPTSMLETTTPLIVGDYLYVQAMEKYGIASGSCIYRVPLADGPGTDNANVTTFDGAAWNSTTVIPDKMTDTTTSAGAYSVSNFDPGEYTIAVKADGYQSYSATVTVESGHAATVNIKLKKSGSTETASKDVSDTVSAVVSISGTITDVDGNPIEGASITVTRSVTGSAYGYGPGSLVYDSGVIFAKCSNGMVYAFDTDLKLVWSRQTDGKSYFYAPTVAYGTVYAGMCDGCLYALDETDGHVLAKQQVCHQTDSAPGSVSPPAVIKRADGTFDVYVTFSTGGMGSTFNGCGVYTFNGSTFTQVVEPKAQTSAVSAYLTHYSDDEINGVIMFNGDNLVMYGRDSSDQITTKVITNQFTGQLNSHAQPILVNGTTLFISTYEAGTAGTAGAQSVYSVDLNGNILGRVTPNTLQYCMCPVTVVDGLIMCGNDAGMFAYQGTMSEYHPPENNSTPVWLLLLYVIAAIVLILALVWIVLRFGKKWEHPYADLKVHVMTYFFGENYTHNTKSKRKLRLVILLGALITLGMALASLCIGSETTIGPADAISAMISSIQKGGRHLDTVEMLIYNQRLPRVLATISVGIGLSVAGAVYQAVIKNPLVEPYIMGVSSGAGTFAIAVITYGFTFFGLFSAQSPFLIATSAIVGGLVAFGLTMLLAMKTGGKSVNFVLAGIIIGLVFSAAQSIMMIGSGTKAASALAWLYGSFISISWETVWLIVFPCILLSLIPLVWAKELNLVLLGEDQAMQMGLDAKKFDALMLVIVSVLTAFCVAFCGIIGFVGLVIPHLSRLILGGDHRLMLPVSMAFGGFLLVTADLLSRVLITGYELPVGAITTIIGVPVFAYLLVKRGRSYDE